MNDELTDTYIGYKRASEIFGWGKTRLYRLFDDPDIPINEYSIGKRSLAKRSEIEAWVESQAIKK